MGFLAGPSHRTSRATSFLLPFEKGFGEPKARPMEGDGSGGISDKDLNGGPPYRGPGGELCHADCNLDELPPGTKCTGCGPPLPPPKRPVIAAGVVQSVDYGPDGQGYKPNRTREWDEVEYHNEGYTPTKNRKPLPGYAADGRPLGCNGAHARDSH